MPTRRSVAGDPDLDVLYEQLSGAHLQPLRELGGLLTKEPVVRGEPFRRGGRPRVLPGQHLCGHELQITGLDRLTVTVTDAGAVRSPNPRRGQGATPAAQLNRREPASS